MQEGRFARWKQLPSLRDSANSTPGWIASSSTPVRSRAASSALVRAGASHDRRLHQLSLDLQLLSATSWSGGSIASSPAAGGRRSRLLQWVLGIRIARISASPRERRDHDSITPSGRCGRRSKPTRSARGRIDRTSDMATDERFDEPISTWLQETAPRRFPGGCWTTVGGAAQAGSRWAARTSEDLSRDPVDPCVGARPRSWSSSSGASPRVCNPTSACPDDARRLVPRVDRLPVGYGAVRRRRGPARTARDPGRNRLTRDATLRLDGRSHVDAGAERTVSVPGRSLPPSVGLRLPAVGTAHGFLFVADGNDVWPRRTATPGSAAPTGHGTSICARTRSCSRRRWPGSRCCR